MALARLGETQLEYERSGEGPPLLAIMGMSGTLLHWGEPFLAPLRERFELIAFEHRGVGASTQLQGPITIREMAEDAGRLMDALELDSAHVLGISMGGMVAQELVLARPQMVQTLTLGCTYCGGPRSRLSSEVAAEIGAAIASGDRERALRVAYELNLSPAFAADPAAWRRYQEIAARRRVAVAVIMAQLSAIAGHDTSERLTGVDTPTLVIHGAEDRMVPVENGRLIASLIPDARLEILEGVGHMFFWEEPERAAGLIGEHALAPA